MKNQFKTLEGVQNFLNDIPYINSGGCAISALTMFRWLKDNNQLTPETKITYIYNNFSKYNNNQDFISGKQSVEPLSCAHAVLYHENKYQDSHGVRDEIWLSNYFGEYFHQIDSENFIVKSINNINNHNWNRRFERCHIEEIQEATGVDLSDIKIY